MLIRRHPILPLVFVTGAAVLAIEVAATRLLAPSFGTTVFAVSGVISVVLAALSLGYFLGGRWADRKPTITSFYLIIFAAGLSVYFIQIGLTWFVPAIRESVGLLYGPIVASAVLFFMPSFLLGTLSPYAVVLRRAEATGLGLGQVAGGVSFWSTMGSIAGSLSTAFVFIPSIGLSTLILGIATLLVLLGSLGLIAAGRAWAPLGGLIAGSPIIVMALMPLQLNPNILYLRDGLYSRILIFDTEGSGRAARAMMLDGSHSAARYRHSDELMYEYTKYTNVFRALRPDTDSALVIGGGAYSIPQALLQQLPAVRVDVAEIEPDLLPLSQRYFDIKTDPRLTNYVEDGRSILRGKSNHYDAIFGDAYYSVGSIPQHLATKEFFEAVRNSLTDNGIFVGNIIGRLDRQKTPSFTLSEIKTFRSVFPNSLFVAAASPQLEGPQNIMYIGFKGELPNLAAATSEQPDDQAILAKMRAYAIDLGQFDFAPHRIFTDDFAPVDYYTATSISFDS